MKLRQNQKPTVKTTSSIVLKYTALGLATLTLIFGVVFIYNNLVNIDETRAEGEADTLGGAGYALTLDGSDDYVALSSSMTNPGQLSAFTVETWVYTTAKPGSQPMSLVDFDGNEYFSLFIRGASGKVGFTTTDEAGLTDELISKDKVNDGEWHHVAVVYDGQDKTIYIDGKESGTIANAHSGAAVGSGTTRYGFIGTGSQADTFDGAKSDQYYEGAIDDVRIWLTARTVDQIRENLTENLEGSESQLAYYFNFDEGEGEVTTDAARDYEGMLQGGLDASGWGYSGVYMGEQSVYTYDASTLSFGIAGKGEVTVTITDGKPQGIHIYHVSSPPNLKELPAGIQAIEGFYWGVYVMGNTQYTLTYDFSNYEGDFDTTTLELAERPNSASGWSHGMAQKAQGRLNIPNQTGTEYILGSSETVMPIELLSFDAQVEDSGIAITWTTSSEQNNDFFSIERSRNGTEYEVIATVNGAGNSDDALSYAFTDEYPVIGRSYYRLKQTDYDGKFEHFAPVMVNYEASAIENIQLSAYPNPSHNQVITVTVEGMLPDRDTQLAMMDLRGNPVYKEDVRANGMGSVEVKIDPTNMKGGNYLIILTTPDKKYTKQVVLRK